MRHCRRCLLSLALLAVAVALSACAGPKDETQKTEGIPVFTADIAAKGGDVVCHIASDNIQGGVKAAQYLVKTIKPDAGTSAIEAHEIVVIDHPTVTSVQDRVRGFEQELAKHPQFVIVDKPTGEGQRVKAMTAMENMLQKHPHLAGVFAINDDSALGALQAVRQAGREEVVIIGYDATPEAREAILKGGPLRADVIQYPDVIGRVTADVVAKHLAGEEVPASVPIAVGIVDRADLEKGITPKYPGEIEEVHVKGLGKRLGVTLLTREHQFYRDLEAALRGEAERLGMTVVFQSADMNVGKQTSQVETFVTQGFDAIVICPADSTAIVGAVKTANKARR